MGCDWIVRLEKFVDDGAWKREQHRALACATVQRGRAVVDDPQVRAGTPRPGQPYPLLEMPARDRRLDRATERQVEQRWLLAGAQELIAARNVHPPCLAEQAAKVAGRKLREERQTLCMLAILIGHRCER